MDDRSVQYPQRYQLKKVDGTDDIYDLIPAPGEITEEGTLINKSALLKDETAALFKDLPEDPVPDDVFKVLSKAALIGDDGELSTSTGEKPTLLSVETTTYVGTGKSDRGNPTSVTFSKTPEFIMVSGPANGSANGPLIGMKNGPAVNVGKTSNSDPIVMTSTTWGPTVSWYDSSFINPNNQMNTSGVQYTAIGIVYK